MFGANAKRTAVLTVVLLLWRSPIPDNWTVRTTKTTIAATIATTGVATFVDGFSETTIPLRWFSKSQRILPVLGLKRYQQQQRINTNANANIVDVPLRSAEMMVSTYTTSTSLKASETNSFPNDNKTPMQYPCFENITIEYCPGCRWMTKAFWMATELLQQYNNELLREVTVIPSEPGTFTITAGVITPIPISDEIDDDDDNGARLSQKNVQLWDRKVDGGFPPIDLIEFDARVKACLEKGSDNLIHLDGDTDDDDNENGNDNGDGDDPTIQSSASSSSTTTNSAILPTKPRSHHVVITYCPNRGHLLRAAYYGQELLTTFCNDGELDAISLRPETGGSSSTFKVELLLREHEGEETGKRKVDTLVLWGSNDDCNDDDNNDKLVFPEVKELKRLVRDQVMPQKDLGHSDEKTSSMEEKEGQKEVLDNVGDCIPCNAAAAATSDTEEDVDDDEFLDDNEAEEARRYFGVM